MNFTSNPASYWEDIVLGQLNRLKFPSIQHITLFMCSASESFGSLCVPAVIGTLLGKSFVSRLVIGWTTGVLVSLIGSYLSYILDFPTGGMVVVTLGLGLFIVALIKGIQMRY